MIGGSLQEMIGKLASVPLPQLHAMTKDPAIGYLAATELRARNQKRAAMQPPMQPPQGTVVDAEAQKAAQAEMAGIMSGIPMQPQQPVQRMANGGVVGFEAGGETSEMELRAKAREISLRTGLPAETVYRTLVMQNEKHTTPEPRRNALDDLGRVGAPRTLAANPIDVMTGFAKVPDSDQVPPPVSDVYPDVRGSMRDPSILRNAPSLVQPTQTPPSTNVPPSTVPPPSAGRSSASASLGIMGGIPGGGGGGGGWSKMPELAQPKEYLTPEMMQTALGKQEDVLNQREANRYRAPDVAAQRAGIESEKAWLDQQNPQDPDVVAAKARLRSRIEALENNRPNNIRQGWIEAGLGMLASQSPFFGVGIGQGGLQGARTFRELQAQDASRLDSLGSQQMQAGLAEQQRRAGILSNAISMNQHREGLQEKERANKDALLQERGAQAMMPIKLAEAAAGIGSKASEEAFRTNASRLGLGELEVRRKSEDTDRYSAESARIVANARASDATGGGSGKGDEDWRYMNVLRQALDSEIKHVMKRTGAAAEFERLTSTGIQSKAQQERAMQLYNAAYQQAFKNVGVLAAGSPRTARAYELMKAVDNGVTPPTGGTDGFASVGGAPTHGIRQK